MTMLILGIFIGANLGLIVGALCCASGQADREPVSSDGYWPADGMHDWMNPDPTTGAEKIAHYRRSGSF